MPDRRHDFDEKSLRLCGSRPVVYRINLLFVFVGHHEAARVFVRKLRRLPLILRRRGFQNRRHERPTWRPAALSERHLFKPHSDGPQLVAHSNVSRISGHNDGQRAVYMSQRRARERGLPSGARPRREPKINLLQRFDKLVLLCQTVRAILGRGRLVRSATNEPDRAHGLSLYATGVSSATGPTDLAWRERPIRVRV